MRRLFVLGSGFSAIAGAPISRTVLPMVFAPERHHAPINNLRSFLDTFLFREETNWVDTTSLEEILSRLDLIRYYRPYNGIDYDQVSYYEELLLYEFTGLLFPENLDSRKGPYKKFGTILESGNIIISFNYDLLVEKIILGAGKSFAYKFDSCDNSLETGINLLKLHGSVNTYYCPDCLNLTTLTAKDIETRFSKTRQGDDSVSYLVCKHCRERGKKINLKHFIIAPTLFKSYSIPVLRHLWYLALHALTEADEIIFIGYSLPEADILSYQLFDFGRKMTNKNQQVMLVNGPRTYSDKFHQIYGQLLSNTGLYFEQWIETGL